MKRKRQYKPIVAAVSVLAALCAISAHYLWDPWDFYWKVGDAETALRMQVVETAQRYLGYNEADGSHRQIIDLYNSQDILPVGYVVQYEDSWCSAFVSAVALECGLTDILPTECGCERHIGLFQELGRWEEKDAAIPLPGDLIFYDWDQTRPGDCTGWSDHVGIVIGTKWPFIKVIEGNKDDSVSYRVIPMGAITIRGFAKPDYAAKTP